jgi:hypothetical protein
MTEEDVWLRAYCAALTAESDVEVSYQAASRYAEEAANLAVKAFAKRFDRKWER